MREGKRWEFRRKERRWEVGKEEKGKVRRESTSHSCNRWTQLCTPIKLHSDRH
jgi:hypothetical protein